jgi:hypothetical protein
MGNPTRDDLAVITGERDILHAMLHELYGISKEEAEKELAQSEKSKVRSRPGADPASEEKIVGTILLIVLVVLLSNHQNAVLGPDGIAYVLLGLGMIPPLIVDPESILVFSGGERKAGMPVAV